MKKLKRAACLLLSAVLLIGTLPVTAHAETETTDQTKALISDVAIENYTGKNSSSFLKISHPEKHSSKKTFDPLEEGEQHKSEVFADGLLDYIPNMAEEPAYGVVGVPGVTEGATGQGDRGQTYSWAAFAYGDWMYVSTLYNSTESTGGLLGHPMNGKLGEVYGDDMFTKQEDGKESGSTLSKINVKTGEVKILMSRAKNGLETSFRNAVAYKDKLYFCGSVNHLPSIFEIDPETDAFQCVYQDPSMRNYPGGPGAAWKEARAKKICPTIRGLSVFKDYLIISTVGMDGNPYIAVSNNPTSGEFKQIAWTWKDAEHTVPGELCGYPACKIPDSIMGGSIWEMVEFNDKLYVAICTGTPDNAPDSTIVQNEQGENTKIIKTMQSFALISGECNGDIENPADWTWTPIVGDKERDGAKYTFGIDPERERSGACNLIVFDDHLYIGEYNDTQIAFDNMTKKEFDFLCRNMDQSVSLYRMDKDNNVEKIMGDPTTMFPEALSGINESGFGRRETQYIWQSRVFNNKLYLGTFDETTILFPIARMALDQAEGTDKTVLNEDLQTVTAEAEEAGKVATLSTDNETANVYQEILEARDFYETQREAGVYADYSYAESDDPTVLLPEAAFNLKNVVKVDSAADLYLAMLIENELMHEDQSGWSIPKRLAAKVRMAEQFDEIVKFIDSNPENVPETLMTAAETYADEKTREQIQDLGDVLKYLQGCIAGFDMYVSADGVHFDEITRDGLGDPYNQGLRAFATNDDPANFWMTIGTANPFYGTQIWRMDEVKNLQPVDPDQVTVAVKFITEDGSEAVRDPKIDWDKAQEIYVDEGQMTVDATKLTMLVPRSYEMDANQNAVEVEVLEDGTSLLTIKVHAAGEVEPPKQLNAPAVEVMNDASTGEIVLSWKPVEGAEKYQVYVAGENNEFVELAMVTDTHYTHAAAEVGQTYQYQVRAIAEGKADSDFSKTVQAVCKCAKPVVSVTTAQTDGKPFLSWKEVSGADQYEILRADNEKGLFVKCGTTADKAYTDQTAQNGHTYYYQVCAVNNKNNAANALSDTVKIVLAMEKLDTPVVNSSNDAVSGKVVLSWDIVEGAEKYKIYAASENGEFIELTTVADTSYTHAAAEAGQTYQYQVRAIAEGKTDSDFSEAVQAVCKCSKPVVNATTHEADGKPFLSWNEVAGSDQYEIRRADNEKGPFVKCGTTADKTYIDKTAKYGHTYYYQVCAVNNKNNEANACSAAVKVVLALKKLDTPVVKINNDAATGKIVLSWASVEDAEKYQIYVAKENGEFTEIYNVNATYFVHKAAEVGAKYQYKIRAVANERNDSDFSKTVQALCLCAQPVVEAIVREEDGMPVLKWNTVNGADKYDIYRANDAKGPFEKHDSTADGFYVDKSAEYGHTYYYKVCAVNNMNDKADAFSDVLMVHVDLKALDAPVIVLNRDRYTGKIMVNWNNIADAVKYDVYCADSEEGPFEKLVTTSKHGIIHEDAEPGVTYFYKVCAVAEDGRKSVFSDVASEVCTCARPEIRLNADDATGRTVLTWNKVDGAVKYEVYCSTDGNGTFEHLSSTVDNYAVHNFARPGQNYYYKVCAVTENGIRSAFSDVENRVTTCARPDMTLTGIESTGKNYLTWSKVDGAVTYEVYCAEDSSDDFTLLYMTSNGDHVTHNSAKPGVKYSYKVCAVAADGSRSAYSYVMERSCTCARPKLTLASVESTGKNYLTWGKVDGAVRYEVYYAVGESNDFELLHTSKTGNNDHLTHSSATPGVRYSYKIRAIAADGSKSSFSYTATQTCACARTDLTLTNKASTGKIYLEWSRVEGADKYIVYCAEGKNGEFKELFKTSGNHLKHGSAKAGVTYYYKVCAVTEDGTPGAFTSIKHRTCDCARPDVSVKMVNGKPYLSWNKIDGAVKYEVYCSVNGQDYKLLTAVNGTHLKHGSAKAGTTYKYRVRAVCAQKSGNSALSYIDTIKVK